MNRIGDAFKGKKPTIVYLMAGDPDLETSAEYILAAQEAGAGVIEIGVPFSDPVAEGEVIQAASARALNAGTRLDGVFDMVASIKERLRVPVLLMTYLNPAFAYGYGRFFARCAEAGISGAIIPDLPHCERGEVKEAAAENGIEVVSFIAPSSGQRIAEIAKDAEGFIYLVSSAGVTGVRETAAAGLEPIVAEIKKHTGVPVAVGFGIAAREQADYYLSFADGIIVGSAVVKIVGRYGKDARAALMKFIRELRG